MKYRILFAAAMIMTSKTMPTFAATPTPTVTCDRYKCSGPNTMQSCLQTYVYTPLDQGDITNCVNYNRDMALKICNKSSGMTGHEKENCLKINCLFGKTCPQ